MEFVYLLDKKASELPDKIAFADNKESITFGKLREKAAGIAALVDCVAENRNILVFMNRSVNTVCTIMGLLYGHKCIVPVDTALPTERIEYIIGKARTDTVVYSKCYQEQVDRLSIRNRICFEDMPEEVSVTGAKADVTGTSLDAAYIFFTSGTTGNPKGCVLSYQAIMNFGRSFSLEMGFGISDRIAGQTPLYYVASLHDILPPLYEGTTTYLLSKSLLLSPGKLLDHLSENRITSLIAVPNVLIGICNYLAKSGANPEVTCIKRVIFGGEGLPYKSYRVLKKLFCEASFYSCYGLTETTTTTCYWRDDRELAENEVLPIGRALLNSKVFLLNERDELSDSDGEICVSGPSVASGYYGDPEETAKVFGQNPLNPFYDERIIRTGDIGYYNSNGELVIVGRKDSQIKYKGHRVETREIELAAMKNTNVKNCACLFEKEHERLVLFYEGEEEEKKLTESLKKVLPQYMIPETIRIGKIPLLSNGKKDMAGIRQLMNMRMEKNTDE